MNTIKMLNHKTGECVESTHIPSLVHEVKRWCYEGMTTGKFSMQGGTYATRSWLREVIRQQQLTSCDICQSVMKVKHMNYITNQFGDAFFGYCNDCDIEMMNDDDDEEFNAIVDSLEFDEDEDDDDDDFLDDDDEEPYEWQKNY